ncbi:MAG TPA: cytochrome c3 family protein [Aggregatilinea sp.]|uniref:cytochrome c3 family protein n=1 Tax=Aggregatilinea sp. TaxID=2806333 RepID=UPI002BA58B4F|nr:cytochrome c3 family protein [Aggregatilinea sp.]HML20877.1 cytochrome c3 family protein [Aggregatilinea sp.]
MSTKFSNGVHAGDLLCEDCHQTSSDTADALSWAVTGNDEGGEAQTASDLCLECHEDIDDTRLVSDSDHLAHPEFECAACHDTHSGRASCTQSGCHTSIQSTVYTTVATPVGHTGQGDPNAFMCGGAECHASATQVGGAPIYHQSVHHQVACYTCHDASGMDIVVDDAGQLVTSLPGQEDALVVPHRLQREVQCTNCHSR